MQTVPNYRTFLKTNTTGLLLRLFFITAFTLHLPLRAAQKNLVCNTTIAPSQLNLATQAHIINQTKKRRPLESRTETVNAYKKAKTAMLQQLNQGETSFVELFISITLDDRARMLRAIKNGGDINFREPATGKTPLMLAAKSARFEIMKALVDNQVDVFCKDYTGNTALDYAKQHLEQAKQTVKTLEEIHHQQQTQINSNAQEEIDFDPYTLSNNTSPSIDNYPQSFPSYPPTPTISNTPSSEQNFFQEDYTQY